MAELRDGDRVFIDANIFIYHFGGRSPECKAFLERCARRELLGYTATPVLAEVLHRLMVAEAIMKGLVTAKTAVKKLGETPALVKQLTQYQEGVDLILSIALHGTIDRGFSVHASLLASDKSVLAKSAHWSLWVALNGVNSLSCYHFSCSVPEPHPIKTNRPQGKLTANSARHRIAAR